MARRQRVGLAVLVPSRRPGGSRLKRTTLGAPKQISANGISLEVEDHGPPSGEPILLIMDLGMQLLGWHLDFVGALVQRGFRVIRFDNRDIGLSSSLDSAGHPNLALGALRFALGWR